MAAVTSCENRELFSNCFFFVFVSIRLKVLHV